jgi:hypothetical protein
MGPDSNRLVVLAGAGASFAASKERFPTTLGFLKKLESAGFSKDAVFAGIRSICQEELGGETAVVDIEHILWRLQEILVHLDPATKQDSSVYKALSRGVFGHVPGAGNIASQYPGAAINIAATVSTLRDKINADLYSHYAGEAAAVEIEKTWLPLLEKCTNWPAHTSIFTTNYDGVLEDSVDLYDQRHPNDTSRFNFGFVGRSRPTLALPNWTDNAFASDASKTILITKLHGSLNWEFVNREVQRSTPTFAGDHSRHPIIYPGYKGYPDREPFRSFQRYFENCVANCSVMIVIGFAFRDEAINAVIDGAEGLRKLIVIDPADKITPPSAVSSTKITHIKAGFESAHSQITQALSLDSPF